MKKQLLFVIPSLAAGGGEKSLINLLNTFNYNFYSVDLLLFNQTGLFLKQVPPQVNIISINDDFDIFKFGVFKSILTFIKQGKPKLAIYRLLFSFISRIDNNKDRAEQICWNFLQEAIKRNEKHYDAAIGYIEKSSIYFVVDKVNATKKIGWVHTNYTSSGLKPGLDIRYFSKLDHIITVSEECAISLTDNFPKLKEKIGVIFNIISPSTIKRLANESTEQKVRSKNNITIVTVSRLSYEKGIDIAIDTCKVLVKKGYDILWYIIGNGEEYDNLSKKIKSEEIENNFFLVGIKENPYAYINMADIYVQPSRYEGKSIAIEEAKVLKKPIVITNFKSSIDQIVDGVNGSIAETNFLSVSNAIEKLIRDKEFREKLINNLDEEKKGTEDEIYKLYQLI